MRLKQIDEYRWEIPRDYKSGMRVPGMIYADAPMLETIMQDQAVEQVANVATLPGITGKSLAMPDIHWGYGFPIGGVAAMRLEDGVVSPGGVGYDINCGVRLLKTGLREEEIKPKIKELANDLYNNIPSGLGSEGRIRLNEKAINEVLNNGAGWAVQNGYGLPEDLEFTEESGCMQGADASLVSSRAKGRGGPQLGTLGSGNHFLEIQAVREIYDAAACNIIGIIHTGQITVMIHTGSRGLGHQVCDDYLSTMRQAVLKYGIQLPDRQLSCAPVKSQEGRDYLSAMACAANFAWANRQCICHWTRDSFSRIFHKSISGLGMGQVYDVAHNIAKLEEFDIDNQRIKLCVHRKGATRSFPPGNRHIPVKYSSIGQPVLIPGDMGRRSYIALGTETAMKESFGSTCHGAGRLRSRGEAKRMLNGQEVARELESRGITVRAHSIAALAEEASQAYKDVTQVVNIAHNAGISRRIAMVEPLAIIKG
jgi:tRNA-splicing ligase RtcB